jgi:hypothetical protein
LNELFESLKDAKLGIEKRRDMLQFLREFTSFLYGLQQTREPFFKVCLLLTKHFLFYIQTHILLTFTHVLVSVRSRSTRRYRSGSGE